MSFYSAAELMNKVEEIKREAAAAALREAEAYRKAAYTEWQRTHPDAAEPPPGPDPHAGYKAWLNTQFDHLPAYFKRFTQPQPEKLNPIIDSLRTLEGSFGGSDTATQATGLAFVNKAAIDMSKWEGHLAENLQNNVLIPFPPITGNHGKIARMLRESMEAARNIYRGQKRDVSDIADKTIVALKACGTCEGSDVRTGLTVVTAIAAIGAIALTPVTGGASAGAAGLLTALTLQSIGSGAAIAGATIPPDEQIPLGAKTVNEVLNNMIAALSSLSQQVSIQERKVAGVLRGNFGKVTGDRQLANSTGVSSSVLPMRPNIISAKGGDLTTGFDPDD